MGPTGPTPFFFFAFFAWQSACQISSWGTSFPPAAWARRRLQSLRGPKLSRQHTARGQAALDGLAGQAGRAERPLAEAVAGNPRLASPLKANPRRAAFFSAFSALPFAEVEKRFLALPSLPYRVAARVLTPAMKEKLRKILK